ncbi:hypothetical protein D8X85_03060 [Listeria seeligeri]|uniref:hypothetical protein n=1 Tax=Listeria seeligeri TaxID=1640 RepID=UPI0019434D41|nr:hypothetical protein [Listeria seeligeri]MBM5604519.1 hypothetical protein [Listeria seeligeri]MBM5676198.1 hypothetical protein [Listeria seeligeri]
MKEVRLFLDYRCYPVWVYDDDGFLEDNDLPDELKEDKGIDERLMLLQDKYDHLFTDTKTEFNYNGFDDQEKEEEFLQMFTEIQMEMERCLMDKYKIINKIFV